MPRTVLPKCCAMGIPGTQSRMVLAVLLLVVSSAGIRNVLCAAEGLPVAHLVLNRRGGAVAQHAPANLTHLVSLLQIVENKYTRAKREVKGNKLVRKWSARGTGTANDEQLLGEPGQEGRWCVREINIVQH